MITIKRLFILYLFLSANLFGSRLVSPVTNRPSPFGPLPAFSTNIFWVTQTVTNDYVDIIFDKTEIKRRLRNQRLPGTTGTVQIRDPWNGTDDKGQNMAPGTYDVIVKVSRTATYERQIPPNNRNLYQEFMYPKDMACDRLGNLYVLDTGLLTVQKFSPDGILIFRWNIPAAAGLTFPTPLTGGISVDTNYRIYVSGQGAAATGRVACFDQDGNLISFQDALNGADDNFSGLGFAQSRGRLTVGSTVGRAVTWYPVYPFGAGTRVNNSTPAGIFPIDYAVVLNLGGGEPVFGVVGTSIYRWNNFWAAANNGTITTTLPPDSRGITSRSNRYLITASFGGNSIVLLRTNGTIIRTYGSKGYGNTNFWAPSSVCWDPVNDRVWVSEVSNLRIVCYDIVSNNFKFRFKVESSEYAPRNLQGLWIDETGNLYVVDNGNRRVLKYNSAGVHKLTIGGGGWSNGRFIDPRGVTVDADGFIYVTDHARNDIQKFSHKGNFVTRRYVNQPRAVKCYGTNIYVAKNNEINGWDDGILGLTRTLQSNSWWWSSWQDDNADDFAIDSGGYFYLADFNNVNQDKFLPGNNSAGTPVGWFNTGTGGGIVCDSFDSLWIVRQGNNDIRVYWTNAGGGLGQHVFSFGQAGSGDGQFNGPTMCAIRERNLPGNWADLWVNDAGNNRLQKFIINWQSEGNAQTTVANSGRPVVTAAFPDTLLSTNVNYFTPESKYYVRKGKSVFKIIFSQIMNTSIDPVVEYITADNYVYTITKSSFIGNIWIGTSWIVEGHDGPATIRVQNAFNLSGSNISPSPTLLYNSFVIDTIPPSVTLIDPVDSYVTVLTSVVVRGITEPDSRVDIFNYRSSSGDIINYSVSNQYSDSSGSFLYPNLRLVTPKDSTNYITVRAKDKAGNWSSFVYPRRLVRCIVAIGYAYVLPSTNRRLGDYGLSPPFLLVWQANAAFSYGTITFDVPSGWSSPSLSSSSPGFVRIYEVNGINLFTGKELRVGVIPNRIKIDFVSAQPGGYVKIAYGTNSLTMVSNSPRTAIGLNEWICKATNDTVPCTNIWNPPKKVGEYQGQSLFVNVIGKSVNISSFSLMPSFTYKGAYKVPAMRLFFVNSNSYHTNRVTSIRLTVLDYSFNPVNANIRLSSLFAATNGTILGSSAAVNSPYVVIDISLSPLVLPPGKTTSLDILMDISPFTSETDVRIRVASKDDITVLNQGNKDGVAVDKTGNFPFTSSCALIYKYNTVTKMKTKVEDPLYLWLEPQMKLHLFKFIILNPQTNVNDIEITSVKFSIEDNKGNGIIPSSCFTQGYIKRWNSGTTYSYKESFENTGSTILFNTVGLYIPSATSVTLSFYAGIKQNVTLTNLRIVFTSATDIKGRDRIDYSSVTNFADIGFSFPFYSSVVDVVKYFRIEHDTLGYVNEWEPVVIKALNYNFAPVTNFNGSVTLFSSDISGEISWTNINGKGVLYDSGIGNYATYTFSLSDNGIAQIGVKSDTAGILTLMIKDNFISFISNNLLISAMPSFIKIKKIASVSNSLSFILKGGKINDVVPGSMIKYRVIYTNQSPTKATNVLLQDKLPNYVKYVSNSIILDGIQQTDQLDGLDKTDFGVTMTNTVTSTLKSIPGYGTGFLYYKVIVK